MTLRINDVAPDFTVNSTDGELNFHDWIGDGYAILFSHPKDFTPVCTTEFGAVAALADEWAKRNTKVAGVSVDNVEHHQQWKADIEQYSGKKVDFPIFADIDLTISRAYDMFPAETVLPGEGRTPAHTATVRSTFIIGPDKKIRLILTYPMSVGRNFQEILRCLDAVRLTDGAPFATPADWKQGEKVIVALSVPTDEAKERFKDLEIVLPYVRKASVPQACGQARFPDRPRGASAPLLLSPALGCARPLSACLSATTGGPRSDLGRSPPPALQSPAPKGRNGRPSGCKVMQGQPRAPLPPQGIPRLPWRARLTFASQAGRPCAMPRTP